MPQAALRGLTWDNDRGRWPLAESVARWAGKCPDVPVRWWARPVDDFAHGGISVLAREYDLIVLDHPHIGQVAAAGDVVALDELVDPSALEDQRATIGRSFASYRWGGRSFAFAIDAACQVAVRRPDLLPYSVLPASPTWDDLLELVEARPIEVRLGLPFKPVLAAMCFFSLCANLGEEPCTSTHEVVSREVGAEAMSVLGRLAAAAHPRSAGMSAIDMLDLMTSSDEVGYVPLGFGYCNYAKPGYREHRVHFENIPCATHGPVGSILGGTGLAVSAHSPNSSVAAEYASWLASGPYQSRAYILDGGQPAHVDAWNSPAADVACGRFLTATRATIDSAYLRPRYPGYITFQEKLGEILHKGIHTESRADEVLSQVNQAYWQSIRGRSGNELALGGVM